MNCKPEDLAIVVRSRLGNLGRVVRCVKLVPAGTYLGATSSTGIKARARDLMWLIEGTTTIQYPFTKEKFEVPYAYDKNLRPLNAPLNEE